MFTNLFRGRVLSTSQLQTTYLSKEGLTIFYAQKEFQDVLQRGVRKRGS